MIKDLAVAGAAVATAYFAYRGINNWIVELRGRTSFEVAHGLLLATYKLRDAIGFCRSRLIEGREVPDLASNATPDQELEQELNRHRYENRWVPVLEVLQDFDARGLEAEALWGSEFRNSTDKLRKQIEKLQLAIESSLGKDFLENREFAKGIRSAMLARSDAKDPLSQSITEAIDEIEKKVRPHIGK